MEEDKARSEATFRYTVKNVSKMEDSQLSHAYYVRNLPWQICVVPPSSQVQKKHPKSSLGFYLVCNKGNESTSWRCCAVAELRLLSYKQGQEPFCRKIEHLFCSKEKDWGYSSFMTWQDVVDPDRGFLKDDSITLEVHVVADASYGISCGSKQYANHIGSKNEDSTSYMNSLSQTLFFSNELRKAVYKMPTESDKSDFVETPNNSGGSGANNYLMKPELACIVQGQEIKEGQARSEVTFRYTVENISEIKDSQLSPAYYVSNLPWQICVVPPSRQTSEKHPERFLGFHLVCNEGSESTSWKCYAVAELRLLSYKQGQEPFNRKIEHLFCSKSNNWGFRRFITWQNVLDPDRDFITDDSITLEVHVMADIPHGVSCDSKKHTDYIRLKNQSDTSYMNSLLQTLFFSNQLRKAVYKMSTENDDSEKTANGEAGGTDNRPMNEGPQLACTVQDQEMEKDKAKSEATFRYTVKNITKIKDFQLSPAYYIHNLPWQIGVIPPLSQKKKKSSKRFLGFFLLCNEGSEFTSWSCYAAAELRLLSCKEGQKPFSRKMQQLFCSAENDWGYSAFITWQDILNPDRGFIKNDSITLEVHVVADAPHGVSCESKKHTSYIGLKNQGDTSYMNSLLQTLFFSNQLRKAVYKMSAENDDSSKISTE